MILITGATGFLASELIKRIYTEENKIRVVSRNEGKLIELKQQYPGIQIISGDIADPCVCERASKGVTAVYHLAAFKHVGLAETQPIECLQSNCTGTLNLLRATKNNGLKFFLFISTDKAAQVAGVYGATKLIAERLIHEYAKHYPETKYRVVRYGNVLYSTGSVLVKWKNALLKGLEITVTEPAATRYFWTLEQAVDLIEECLLKATDSRPYCPEMKSMSVGDLLDAMQAKYGKAVKINTIGLQPGENLHEKILEKGKTSAEVERYTVDEIAALI